MLPNIHIEPERVSFNDLPPKVRRKIDHAHETALVNICDDVHHIYDGQYPYNDSRETYPAEYRAETQSGGDIVYSKHQIIATDDIQGKYKKLYVTTKIRYRRGRVEGQGGRVFYPITSSIEDGVKGGVRQIVTGQDL